MIIKGNPIADRKYIEIGALLEQYSDFRSPSLAIILVGNNPDSERYISRKLKKCAELNIQTQFIRLSEEDTFSFLINTIEKLNSDPHIDGIILQMPLPEDFVKNNLKHMDRNAFMREIIDTIDPTKDIDGLTSTNIGKYIAGDSTGFVPATAMGVMSILDSVDYDLEDKKVVVIGRSLIVGKPLSNELINRNAIVTVLHSKVTNPKEFTQNADVVIAAAGSPKLVTADMVKEGAFVIDVGMNLNDEGKLEGDVDFENVEKKASYITPVPGGVGPLTVFYIISNLIEAYVAHVSSE